MVQSLNTPDVIVQPIAENGNKNTIPPTNDGTTGAMSQSVGFPPITSQRLPDGGRAVRRADINGALNLISQPQYFAQIGGTYTFRQDVSDAIGGYPLGAVLWYKDSATGDYSALESLKANNKANFNTNPEYVDDGVNWKKCLSGSSGGLEIGDIGIAPFGIDETQNKRRYLNGQVISQAQFATFTVKLKKAVELYPSLATSEAAWQNTVSNSQLKQCGQFVIDDSAGTIRLPKVKDISGTPDLAGLGGLIRQSAPNITGNIVSMDNGSSQSSGAFTTTSVTRSTDRSGIEDSYWFNVVTRNFSASRSNSTYGSNGTILHQEAVRYPYFIQVATGVEESVDVSKEIQLNNPFFLGMSQYFENEPNNLSWLKSDGQFKSGTTYDSYYQWLLKIKNGTETAEGVSVKLSTESYDDYDFVLNTSNTTFRLPLLNGSESIPDFSKRQEGIFTTPLTADKAQHYVAPRNGAVYVYGYNQNTGSIYLILNNVTIASSGIGNTLSTTRWVYTSCKKGDRVSLNSSDANQTFSNSFFVPCVGNGSLYYYVGETVQDANIIAASGIIDRLGNFVTLDTPQTITGLKTIARTERTLVFKDDRIDNNVNPSTNLYDYIDFVEKNGINIARYASFKDFNGYSGAMMQVWAANNSRESNIRIGIKNDGVVYTYCPPCRGWNSIATTAAIALSQNGYVKFGNGLIIQWGRTNNTGNFVWATPFSNSNSYSVAFSSSVLFDIYNTYINIRDKNHGSSAKPTTVFFVAIGF